MVTDALLKVYPRNPPMRPRINPTKFIDIKEKTSTSIDPIFLLAALLNNSHEPAKVAMPAMTPHAKAMVPLKIGMLMAWMVTNAVIRVISPASADSAKAAVGFGDTFTAKVHPDR